jgi:hypothetical protein
MTTIDPNQATAIVLQLCDEFNCYPNELVERVHVLLVQANDLADAYIDMRAQADGHEHREPTP